MAALGNTPIQHFRTRTTARNPGSFVANTAGATASGGQALVFNTADLPATGVFAWSIDTAASLSPGTTVVGVMTAGAQTTLTLSQPTTAIINSGTPVNFQQLREGELFINTQDNRLAVGGYAQQAGGTNAAVLSIIDMIPSVKAQAGRALRVSDDGLTIIWGNVSSAGGAVNAVWAGQQTNPITSALNQSSGIVTTPTTSYGVTTLGATVVSIATQLVDQTWDITFSSTTGILVGFVLSNSAASLNLGNQVRVNLVRSATVLNVTSTQAGTTPWGGAGMPTSTTVVQSGLGSTGIQGTGFVGTDLTVLPYMQNRNLNNYYAPFSSTTMDTGISSAGRNPAATLPAPLASTVANVVHPLQGGFGAALSTRTDIVNAAHPIQTTDTGSYMAKSYANWTAAGFTASPDNAFFFRLTGQNGIWPSWQNTNRQQLVSDGINAQWQNLPQPIQNVFFRFTRNNATTFITNKGIYQGAATWLAFSQQTDPSDTAPEVRNIDRVSINPINQDEIVDIIQTAPVPIAAGGTGIDLRRQDNAYWDGSNNRLSTAIAWAIPAYGTSFQGEMQKILPPFTYDANPNIDPSTTTSYVMSYKAVGGLPTWSDSIQGIQLQGAALPATNTFTNSNRPLRLEGLGRFGVWSSATGGVSSYTAYTADGTIQAPTLVTGQNLTIRGSTAAADSRLVIQQATTPTGVGNGLVNIRIDSGVTNVNNQVGSSLNQIAEDFSSVTLMGTAPSFTVSNDFLSGTVTYVSGTLVAAGQTSLNLVLDHTGQSLTSFCGGQNRTVSGLIIFQVAAGESISKLSINITAPNLGSVVTRVLRPLAGIVVGQYVVISWVATGTVALITVAAGD